MKRVYIAAESIWSYLPLAYAAHLRGIMAHDRKMKKDAKERSKAKAAAYAQAKPASRAWNFRTNHKGTGIIMIRGRKPRYITRGELMDMVEENPGQEVNIHGTIARKKIEVRDD